MHLFSVHRNRRLIEYEAGSGQRTAGLEGYTFSLDDPNGIISWVARHGETVLANDVRRDERYLPSPLPPENTNSELARPAPLSTDAVVGVLDIQSEQDQCLYRG